MSMSPFPPTRRAAVGMLLTSLAAPWARAATYPERAIRLIIGSSAGSSPDLIARTVARGMADDLKQPVVVDNRPGASTTIALYAISRASPDGLTIGYVTTALVLNRVVGLETSFDFETELRPIVQVGIQPTLLVVSGESTYGSLADLVADARERPGRISYASTGAGSILNLAGEMLQWAAGIQFLHVPYTLGPQALLDLQTQRVDAMFNPVNVVVPHLRDGRLRALGITSQRRSRILPDVPTFAEQGYRDMEVLTWGGLVAPAQTPDDLIGRLNTAANAALETAELRQTLTDSGYDLVGGTAAAFGAFLRQELRKWSEVVRRGKQR
jgi:tripartite-type tricarboxylate transporter receptor subunit TctC